MYEGSSLFETFDKDVQKQIQTFLEQLVNIINEAHQLMKRHYGIVEDDINALSPPSFSGFTTPSPLALLQRPSELGKKPSKTFLKWRWSLHDKKRVEGIVDKFANLNDRIHGNIKLWCLGTSIGVDLRHLRHLEEDDNSKRLGFNVDAKLQLLASEAEVIKETYELKENNIKQALLRAKTIEGSFAMVSVDGDPLLLEYRSYFPDAPGPVDLDPRTRERIEKLAKLLHQPKEQIFRTPSCHGWVLDLLNNRVAFVFGLPPDTEGVPTSLLQAISSPDVKPSLGQKFRLAHELSRCISQLQLVKWVRTSFHQVHATTSIPCSSSK